ncbi:MAG: hypothetical protein H6726_06775 [Sandaracinaceae bacterium]|nr:hypothetical protein [Myxococcales bacterium]MCB9657341.1 hypothetical protein [Sandaracinaceae bacterium]
MQTSIDTQTKDTQNQHDTDADFAAMPSLYRHAKRSEWGLGVILDRRVDRVTMQFQDGRARAMHLDYWELLQPADRTYDAAHALVSALHAMAPEELRPSMRKGRRPIALAEQVAYFRELFEGGFRDAAYAEEHRSDGRKRLLKRHRDGMVRVAAKLLSSDALREAHETNGPSAVHGALRRVLESSSIVTAQERAAFAAVDVAHHAPIAEGVHELLHGKASVPQRLDGWVRVLEAALGTAPSWELATFFLAAFHPTTLPVVRPKTFERQARFMAPGLRVGERPMGILYARLVRMTTDIRARLREHGLEARDQLDVFDFVWLTLKPAGRERILALRSEAFEAPTPVDVQERAAA